MSEPPEISFEDVAREYEDEQFLAWVDQGLSAGWLSEPVCMTHDTVPLRPWEEDEFDEGLDPCVLVARVWRDGLEDYNPEGK